MSKKKVLLIAYGGGHINLLIPIYYELESRGYTPIVIGLTTACEALDREGIEFLSYRSFLDEQDNEALLLGREIASGMSLNQKVPYEETVAYMGVCYRELIEDHGLEGAHSLYEHEGRQSFMPTRYMRRILDSVNPDFVVTTTSPRSEEAMVYAASEMGVPCYCVVDFGYDLYVTERLGRKGYGNKIFVPFEVVKERLEERGRSPEEIEVVGNPVFDFLGKFSVEENKRAFRREKSWGDKYVILWAKSVFDQVKQIESDVEKALIEKFSNDKEVKLVFRPHPNDTRDYSGLDEKIHLSTTEEPVRSVIAASDVVVTVNSTVGLEANLMGKPVVQVDMLEYSAKVPFDELGIGDVAKSVDSLLLYFRERIFSDHSQVITPCFKVGCSSSRIVDSIEAEIS